MRYLASLILVALLTASWTAAAAEDRCGDTPPADFKTLEGTPFEKVRINADEIDFPGRNVVVLKGYAQLFRGGHRVSSDELVFYKAKNMAEARGSVTLQTRAGDVVKTDVLAYDIATGMAVSGPAEFSIANRRSKILGRGESTVNAYGTAARVSFESADIMLLDNADVISCLDGAKDITFQAESLRVDLTQGVSTGIRVEGSGTGVEGPGTGIKGTGTRVKVRIENPGKHKKLDELQKLID